MPAAKKKGARESSARKSRGRTRGDAIFPAPAQAIELPEEYAETLAAIKTRIQQARHRVAFAANAGMIRLYWDIGRTILERQARSGWGSKVIDRLAQDLRTAYPELKGFSPRNLLFMRSFAEAYPDPEIVKQLVSPLPWGHLVRLLQRVKDSVARDWYAREAVQQGWSRSILELEIDRDAHRRRGRAPNNFGGTLPPQDSEMAEQAFKDPYLFDFLGTADVRREQEVEQALVDHIQHFLLELGAGFAFVGRQVHLEVGEQDFYLDLLFYHLHLRCYVVIDLKVVPFDPAFVGKLNLYLSAVDDLLRHPEDRPSIGLLLCRSKNEIVVEYALRDLKKPIGVAGWATKIVERLPEELKGSLPTVEEFEAELEVRAGEGVSRKARARKSAKAGPRRRKGS